MLFSVTTLLALLPAAILAGLSGEAIERRAPLIQARSPNKAIPGNYIVKLKDGSTDAALNKALGGYKAGQVYRAKGFKGFAGALDEASLEAVRKLPEVEYVEEDGVFTINSIISQTGAPWNLARISSHTPGSTVYKYDSSAGANTCSYIIDTGIYTAHSQFGGRAVWGANFVDTSNTDGNGHGTAIAGVVGAVIYGVAKQTTLIAVKVLDAGGSGTTSGVIAGMNYVATDHLTRSCPNGTVANMSIGGAFSAAVNSAARALVNSGVFLAVAAGGSGGNAANYSPASEPLACTVGASTQSDSVATSSNYGAVLDIYAPGQNILTTWLAGGTNTLSGTSLASAHIAGLGAYLLRLLGPMTGSGLCNYMRQIATQGVLTGVPAGTSNLLAYNGWDL